MSQWNDISDEDVITVKKCLAEKCFGNSDVYKDLSISPISIPVEGGNQIWYAILSCPDSGMAEDGEIYVYPDGKAEFKHLIKLPGDM